MLSFPFHARGVLATAMLLFVVVTGCSGEKKGPEVITLEGSLERIRRSTDNNGEITVRYYNEKQRQEITGAAQVTEETEILLGGVKGRLMDLQEGQRVRGQVRVEKINGQRKNTAVRIEVDAKSLGTGG